MYSGQWRRRCDSVQRCEVVISPNCETVPTEDNVDEGCEVQGRFRGVKMIQER